MPKSQQLTQLAKSGQGPGSPSSLTFQGGEVVPPFDSMDELVIPTCPLVFFLCLYSEAGAVNPSG